MRETTSRTIETTSRVIEMTTRGCRADEGRGKAEGVSGRLETTGRYYSLVTTGQLIYSRVQGERSRVESQREGVYTEHRTLSIYGKGEDRKQGNQMIARRSNRENETTEIGSRVWQ